MSTATQRTTNNSQTKSGEEVGRSGRVGGTKEGGDDGGSSRKRNEVKPRDRQADEDGVANMEKWHASITTIVFFFEKGG
jgi:hypothetical protein